MTTLWQGMADGENGVPCNARIVAGVGSRALQLQFRCYAAQDWGPAFAGEKIRADSMKPPILYDELEKWLRDEGLVV